MVTTLHQPLIAARITPEKKARFAALATSQGLSESALLMRLVDQVLEWNPESSAAGVSGEHRHATERISLRLRPGDGARLRERAASRAMKPATYLATLIRAHLRRDVNRPGF